MSLTFSATRTIQNTNFADIGQVYNLNIRIYHEIALARNNNYTVTFLTNSAPYFSTTLPEVVVNCGYASWIYPPVGVDDEGNDFYVDVISQPTSATSLFSTYFYTGPYRLYMPDPI